MIYNSNEIIEKFVARLEDKFSDTSWDDLNNIVDQIENEIENEILLEINNFLVTHASNTKYIDKHRLKIRNYNYELEVQSQFLKEIPKKYTLEIGLQPNLGKGQRKLNMIDESFTFDNINFGKFSGSSIYLPKSLKSYIDPIQNITSDITRTGYSFYKTLIIEKLTSFFHKELSEILYNKLRQILENHNSLQYNDYIWFTLVSKEEGFYLVDNTRITSAINNLLKTKDDKYYIPSQVITSFLTTVLPFKKMNSINLMNFKEGETLDFELEASKYVTDHPDFKYSEEIVYLTKTLTAMIISKESNKKLIMAFPIEYKEEIKRVFTDTNVKMLTDTFNQHKGKLQKRIRSSSLNNYIMHEILRGTGSILGGIWGFPTI